MSWAMKLESRSQWDKRFMQLAYCIRGWSKDSRPVGAVLVNTERRVIGTGYNGFPAGIADNHVRLADQELKRELTIHAELNCVLNAVSGMPGSTLYVTRFPCIECAKTLIQAGVKRVASPAPEVNHDTWGHSHQLAVNLFCEAGVELTELN